MKTGQAGNKRSIALVVGTRPEAIKMAPVYRALLRSSTLAPVLISSGQHRELLQSAFEPLGLVPDFDLDVMTPGQTSSEVLSRVVDGAAKLLASLKPAALLVQGDTTTVHAAALAGYFARIPVGHVEAGLRTYDHENPFPEEGNRQMVDRISEWCFVPTQRSKENLLSERIAEERIFVTGNTAVDSILWAINRSDYTCEPNTLLVTLHRQESFGEPLREILLGICDFLDANPDVKALWPVHPNPRVQEAIDSLGTRAKSFECVAPMDYLTFSGALGTCRLVVTDSGGIQEEAPSLGKRVLITREQTERPEALAANMNVLVERKRESVSRALQLAWGAAAYEGALPAANPYGDGRSGEKITALLEAALTQKTG
ncbi:MAG: UDP-N-acetylglucosamine 2-epimerase (non-hydrolyzing) [Myxococcota bacterium]|jgi:UDP-N-acetylglucosamine 2-epimerase (non-hydrolysing)